MVENDLLIGKRFCQLQHIAELRLEQPGIESQSVLGISGKAGAKGIRSVKTFRSVKRRSEDLCIGIPGACMADPLEPPVAGCNQRFDHRIDSFAQCKVGMADDCGTRPVIAVEPARALCRHAVHEFDLAHGFHRVAAICVVKGTAFHEHGADDVMAAMRVRMQFVEGVVSCPGNGIDEIVSRFGEGRDQGPQIP